MNDFDIFGGIVDAAKLGYNLYTNKRDFDYQKALQQQIFQREDTAVQRRMADLQAAGLNPNLAAGSAAGAGAVVSRSNTNDLGSALDTVQALNSIRLQKQETQNKKIENQVLQQERFLNGLKVKTSYADVLNQLGFNPKITLNADGSISVNGKRGQFDYSKTPAGQLFDYNLQNQRNSADYLQKELNWYTANQVTNLVTSLLPNIGFPFGKHFK